MIWLALNVRELQLLALAWLETVTPEVPHRALVTTSVVILVRQAEKGRKTLIGEPF